MTVTKTINVEFPEKVSRNPVVLEDLRIHKRASVILFYSKYVFALSLSNKAGLHVSERKRSGTLSKRIVNQTRPERRPIAAGHSATAEYSLIIS